jgi:hypothetical protein
VRDHVNEDREFTVDAMTNPAGSQPGGGGRPLAGPQASMATGTTFTLDGGWTAK